MCVYRKSNVRQIIYSWTISFGGRLMVWNTRTTRHYEIDAHKCIDEFFFDFQFFFFYAFVFISDGHIVRPDIEFGEKFATGIGLHMSCECKDKCLLTMTLRICDFAFVRAWTFIISNI